MFLNTRDEFSDFLSKNKRPLMATFYKDTRKKLKSAKKNVEDAIERIDSMGTNLDELFQEVEKIKGLDKNNDNTSENL